jgi:uncharacterized SAM-binding protein YcdF (DUF218 family)
MNYMNLIRKLIKYLVLLFVILLILDGVFVYTIAHWRPEIKKADAIIVLGAAINTPALYNRTLEGLHLYEQGKADVMVLSGGKISETDISEAQYMERVIKKNTTKTVPYILEEQSHSTYENITNSKKKLGETDSVIIVSDQFHLGRAMLLAKRAGFDNVYWSAPWPTYYSDKELRFYYIREILAMINYLPKLIGG